MHSNILGVTASLLLTIIGFNANTIFLEDAKVAHLPTTFQEIIHYQDEGEDIMVVDLQGNQYENPTASELQSLSPDLFSMNRVRLSLNNKSDDGRCSTEIELRDDSGELIGNYSLNTCAAHGWVFFTSSECFDINLYHDAGSEAPYGNEVKGSVDWTFTFNQQQRISGTYYDGGTANMMKVASPCYKKNELYSVLPLERLEKTRLKKLGNEQ